MAFVSNYIHTENIHNTIAAEEFIPILLKQSNPKSVVDVGCGLGTWLKIFKKHGISDILGIDGNYIDKTKLHIDKNNFLLHDLTAPLIYHKRFDLALCLEVAEHLPENKADNLVNTLTDLADTILFSAALPDQGGQNHINEQSFSYWVQKFNNKGYIVKDLFRKQIWDNKKIDWWYRQNMFLVVKSNEKQEKINDYHHPIRYCQISKELKITATDKNKLLQGNIPIKQAVKILIKSILNVRK